MENKQLIESLERLVEFISKEDKNKVRKTYAHAINNDKNYVKDSAKVNGIGAGIIGGALGAKVGKASAVEGKKFFKKHGGLKGAAIGAAAMGAMGAASGALHGRKMKNWAKKELAKNESLSERLNKWITKA